MFESKLWAFRFSQYETRGKAAELNAVEHGRGTVTEDQSDDVEKAGMDHIEGARLDRA